MFSIVTPSHMFVSAQAGGNLSSSVNLEGVGAVALECVSSNLGGNSPFGQAVGAVAGGSAGAAVGQSIGGETGAQIGGAIGTFAGGVAGDYIGGAVNNAVDNVVNNVEDQALGAVTSAIPGAGLVVQQSVPIEVVEDSQEAEDIKSASERQTVKEECLDRIAQWAAITVMDRLTLATLDWINSGFEGRPFYLEDPEQFFGDLARREILGITSTFSGNGELYPFGETLARTILTSFQRTFEQNMIISLNNVLAHGTQAQWESNFSVGGWAGYTAFVEPNNNIFGFYLESSNQLGRRLQGTTNSTAVNIQAELSQGLGFLSQKKCMQTANGGEYIPQNNIRYIDIGITISEVGQIPTLVYAFLTSCDIQFDTDGDGEDDTPGECIGIEQEALLVEIAEDYRQRSNCTSWKTITPGNQISQSLTRALANPENQLLLVDEFNENLGLILDALFLQLAKEGVAAFTEDNPNNVALQQVQGLNPGQQPNTVTFIELLNGTEGAGGGSGSQGLNNENVSSLVETQEEYIESVQLLIDLYAEIFQRTFDLDYCIPGPNPLWQINASNNISSFFLSLPSYESYPTASWLQITPQEYQGLVGIVSSIPGFEDETDAEQVLEYVHDIYSLFIAYFTSFDNVQPNIISRDSQFSPMLSDVFSDYADIINQRFILADDFVGNVKELGFEYFLELNDVNQSIVEYENSLVIAEANLENLIDLREQYADIERQYIIEYLETAVNQQGISSLADNLQTFQSFSSSQVTYIGSNNENSAYHNAVIALNNEVGQIITPPLNYPGYGQILDDMADLIPNTVFESNLSAVTNEIQSAIQKIGNQGDQNSLIGLSYSCVQQVTQSGPFQNIPFSGYTQRLEYPFPLSSDIPGLANLPTTDSFLPDVSVTQSNTDSNSSITLPIIGNTGNANGLGLDSPPGMTPIEVFETYFINMGQDLY